MEYSRTSRGWSLCRWLLLLVVVVHAVESDKDRNNGLDESDGGLVWCNVSAAAVSSSKTNDKLAVVLQSFSGHVANGDVCGVLGPSGSGKTTFLSAIAGRPDASLQVKGDILHYHNDVDDNHKYHWFSRVSSQRVAWLQQHDVFFEQLTVKETLDLAVFLEWSTQLPAKERHQLTQTCLESLGLASVQNRRVGKANSKRGPRLSGGERRRLSVALELVTMPTLLIADEPTTGLDTKMAENTMRTIVSLVKKRQIPCFCSIHQPRSSIWHLLDSLILMAPGGRVCYMGKREDACAYFETMGYACPSETNPAEFLIDLVSLDLENPMQAAKDKARIDRLALEFSKHNHKSSNAAWNFARDDFTAPSTASRRSHTTKFDLRFLRRFGALFRRALRQSLRPVALNAFRLMSSAGTALLLSAMFPSVAKGEPKARSVADRICLLTFGSITMFLMSVLKSVGVFSKERPVVQREKNRNDYTSLQYLLAKSLAEFPLDSAFTVAFTTTLKYATGLTIGWKDITTVFAVMSAMGSSLGYLVGSITPTYDSAVSLAIPVVVIYMVVGVINPGGVDASSKSPGHIEWLKRLSPIASAVEALGVSEFSGMEFAKSRSFFGFEQLRDLPRMGGLAMVRNGDEALSALGIDGVDFKMSVKHIAKLCLINLACTYLCLSRSDSSSKSDPVGSETSPGESNKFPRTDTPPVSAGLRQFSAVT